MTNELQSQIENQILDLHNLISKLTQQYVTEYVKQNPKDYFGKISAEERIRYLMLPQWEKDYLNREMRQ